MTALINIIIVVISIFAVNQEANAGCLFKPPFKCKYTSLPSLAYKLNLPALPKPSAFLPCPKPATKVTNKPDVTIPLPLPSEIPIGRFCTCQKYAIKPTMVPCLPADAPPIAAPVPFAPPVSCGAPISLAPPLSYGAAAPLAAPIPSAAVPSLALSPDILSAILARYVAPAVAVPPSACSCV